MKEVATMAPLRVRSLICPALCNSFELPVNMETVPATRPRTHWLRTATPHYPLKGNFPERGPPPTAARPTNRVSQTPYKKISYGPFTLSAVERECVGEVTVRDTTGSYCYAQPSTTFEVASKFT